MSGGAWSKIAAASGASSLSPPPGAWGGSLSRSRPIQPPAPGPSPPRGPTLGDILDRQLNPNPQPKAPAWGGAGVREAFHEESAADLEGGGGDDDEGLAFAISQQQQALAGITLAGAATSKVRPFSSPLVKAADGFVFCPQPQRSLKDIQDEEERARQKTSAQEGDPMLFWDYGAAQDPSKAPIGSRPIPPPPPPPARPPGMMSAAAIAAKSAAVPAPPKGGWTAAAVVGKVMVPPLAPAPPPARPTAPATTSKPAAPVARPLESSAPEAPPVSDNVVLMIGDSALSSEFRDWCRDQLVKLNGSDDLSLVEVVLSMASRSEVADTCNMALGNKTGECHHTVPALIPS